MACLRACQAQGPPWPGPIDDLLDFRGFNLHAILEIEPDHLTDGDHEHDGVVTSFVFRESRPLNLERAGDFLSGVIPVDGTKLMRYQGVLNIQGTKERVLPQGVHRTMGTDARAAWKRGVCPRARCSTG